MWALGDIIDLNGDGVSSGYEIFIGDIIVVSLLITAIIVIGRFVFKIRATSNKFDAFMEDWYGEVAREGIEPRPGVLIRLKKLESTRQSDTVTLNSIQETVNSIQAQVEHELNRNGGGSTKDAAHEALKVATEIQAAQAVAIEEQARFRQEFLEHERVTNAEWQAVFSTVKEMIGKPVAQQMELWVKVADAHIQEDDSA